MTFIDWSDSEEMIGLLIEYVADARTASHGDPKRQKFLSNLLADLQAEQLDLVRFQKIYESLDPDFKNDDVVIHVHDCIEELNRLKHE
ncbi:hypothetical protein L0152_25760 [bacterium]|nr:hypothetical protein [bacterium]